MTLPAETEPPPGPESPGPVSSGPVSSGPESTGPVSSGLVVALVGPCAAGKSTLATALRAEGYEVRHVAQEHSGVPDMWRRIAHPDLLIFLDVSYDAALARRPHGMGGPDWMEEQARRLEHAREHCDYYLDTSELTPGEVAARALDFLKATRRPGDEESGA